MLYVCSYIHLCVGCHFIFEVVRVRVFPQSSYCLAQNRTQLDAAIDVLFHFYLLIKIVVFSVAHLMIMYK